MRRKSNAGMIERAGAAQPAFMNRACSGKGTPVASRAQETGAGPSRPRPRPSCGTTAGRVGKLLGADGLPARGADETLGGAVVGQESAAGQAGRDDALVRAGMLAMLESHAGQEAAEPFLL